MIGSGIIVFLQFTIFLFAGSLIYLVTNNMDIQKDREFTYFIVNFLPIGVKGFLLRRSFCCNVNAELLSEFVTFHNYRLVQKETEH